MRSFEVRTEAMGTHNFERTNLGIGAGFYKFFNMADVKLAGTPPPEHKNVMLFPIAGTIVEETTKAEEVKSKFEI